MFKPTICTRQMAVANQRRVIQKPTVNYAELLNNVTQVGELGRFPKGFWKEKQNQKQYLDWLFNRLGFKQMEDWYKTKVRDVVDNRGKGLLDKYQGCISNMLMEVYSDYKWLPWKFGVVPHHYWNTMSNQRQYFDWLFHHLGFKDMTDWYSLRQHHIRETGGRNLLDRTYANSVSRALVSVYPEYSWDFSKFSRVPRSYWNHQTLGKLLIEVAEKLHITNLNDWYRISKEQLLACGAHHVLLQNGGLYQVLKNQFPDHNWIQHLFEGRTKRAAQRWMKVIVCQIFSKDLHTVQVLEDYMHPELRFTQSKEKMQLDLFIPEWKLAFEYQGQHHYHDSQIFGPVRQYLDRDINKKKSCAEHGISLIIVPYWWDGKLASLASTIHLQRPDLKLNEKFEKTLDTPIPDEPPALAKRLQNYDKDPQHHLAMATDYDGHSSLAGWMISEKHDGLRAFWDGSTLYSRQGRPIRVPSFWTEKLPKVKLDGELWMGPNTFQDINNLMRSKTESRWEPVQYYVFDTPEDRKLPFVERYKRLEELAPMLPSHAKVVKQTVCKTDDEVQAFLREVLARGGEGIVARHTDSAYEAGRSPTFVRIKPLETEVKFVQVHRQKEALQCEQRNGKRCLISCPPEVLSNPPKADTILTVRHFGVESSGKLKQGSYLRERHDISWEDVHWN